ncbi:MAG: FKBP-type peptidyl-prolyl cis-trans isomerase [Paludibacteraceae bacterium]
MKKYIYVVLVAVFAISCTTSKKVQTTPVMEINPLSNAVDSMSYALGVNVGSSFANDLKNIPGGKANTDLLIKGFTQALKGDSTLLSNEFAQTYFRDYMTVEQRKENEIKKGEGEKFLAENKLREGIQTTASGLQYMILQSGNGAKPVASDKVKVHYTGTTIDGHVFDSSVERGEPVEFGLNQVIKGWGEGVQLMNVGSKYKLFIPYELAYGDQGIPQANIPPFAPLIFDVELLEIVQPEPEPAPITDDVEPATVSEKKTTKKK